MFTFADVMCFLVGNRHVLLMKNLPQIMPAQNYCKQHKGACRHSSHYAWLNIASDSFPLASNAGWEGGVARGGGEGRGGGKEGPTGQAARDIFPIFEGLLYVKPNHDQCTGCTNWRDKAASVTCTGWHVTPLCGLCGSVVA